jgi:PIN domain nuclease of toxin-antitoxin system
MIILDTHAWLYWVNDNLDQFTSIGLRAIKVSNSLGVSIASCWETAMLVSSERIKMNMDVQRWIDEALQYEGLRLLNLNPEITTLSARLPGVFNGDPVDRLIAATCMAHNVPLLTRDRKFHDWGHIRAIW